MMAADNLGTYFKAFTTLRDIAYLILLASYGSLARFKDIRRLQPVGNYTIIGAGGDMSDFQYIQHVLENLMYDHKLLSCMMLDWLTLLQD